VLSSSASSLSLLLLSLSASFRFLGDITNLPKEDKRLWAEHLLEQSRRASEVPYEVLYDDEPNNMNDQGSQKSGLGGVEDDNNSLVTDTDTAKIQRAIMNTTMISVDQVQSLKQLGSTATGTLNTTMKAPTTDAATWREGLLRLRTMFPGAGNFSGFGVGIEAPEDTALFQRLLNMKEDLRKIENVQTLRYQQRFYEGQKLEQQRLAEIQKNATVTTPSGKKIKAFKPSFSASPPKSRGGGGGGRGRTGGDNDSITLGEESSLFTVSSLDGGGGGGDNDSLHLSRPLGTNIYAGNLKKVLSDGRKNK
jgi:hypothetical protein